MVDKKTTGAQQKKKAKQTNKKKKQPKTPNRSAVTDHVLSSRHHHTSWILLKTRELIASFCWRNLAASHTTAREFPLLGQTQNGHLMIHHRWYGKSTLSRKLLQLPKVTGLECERTIR